MSVKRFLAYVDEAGDEGFTWRPDGSGASHWFVMAAAIVEKENDVHASQCVNRIKGRLGVDPQKPLHWMKCRRHAQRKVIVQEIAPEPISVVVVGVYKPAITKAFLKKPPALYLYTARMVLERVSWLVGDQRGRVDCVFENRASLSYQQLEAYIRGLSATYQWSQVRPVIDTLAPKNKNQSKMLQVADACAGAGYAALSKDEYGNTEPSFLLGLRSRLYRKNGKLLGYGLKLFPVRPGVLAKQAGYEWLRELE